MIRLSIIRTPTYFKIQIKQEDVLAKDIRSFVKKHICDFVKDYRFNKYVQNNNYTYYDDTTNYLHIPITYLSSFKEFLNKKHNIKFNITEDIFIPTENINIKLKKKYPPRDERQLNAINYLENNNYRKGLAIQTGCLIGETIVSYNDHKTDLNHMKLITLKEAYDWYTYNCYNNNYRNGLTLSFNYSNKFIPHKTTHIVYSGKQKVWQITLENGFTVTGTKEHFIFTKDGYIPLMYTRTRQVLTEQGYSKCVKITYKGIQDTYDICCEKPYHNFVANGIVVHNSGKTFCSIKAICDLKYRALIIMESLLDQWKDEILKFTTCRESDIFIIAGTPSLKKLLKLKKKPKIILASLATIRNNLKYEETEDYVIAFEDFIKQYNIGIKIMDEVHRNFKALTDIDLKANVLHNVYLTATFTVNNPITKQIFDTVYPSRIIFGGQHYNKYIKGYFYKYKSDILEKYTILKRGYMHVRWENQMFNSTRRYYRFLTNILIPLIKEHYLDIKSSNEKLLIYFHTINVVDKVYNSLKSRYPKLKVICYYKNDPKEKLKDADIIISTPRKASVGTDIKNLRTVISTVSTRAYNAVVQTIGRLRKLKSNNTPRYIDMCDFNIESQKRHYYVRRRILQAKCKNYYEWDLGDF